MRDTESLRLTQSTAWREKPAMDNPLVLIRIFSVFQLQHVRPKQFKVSLFDQGLNKQLSLRFQGNPELALIVERPVIATIIKINSYFTHGEESTARKDCFDILVQI